jgi:probable RNA-binding protein EIF1AD
MARPKRNVLATALESSTPPTTLSLTQAIARVVNAAGNNLYSVELPSGKTLLVEMPSRFRNTIWVKRGGYVLIDTNSSGDRDNKLNGGIVNVVRDEKDWRKEPYWSVLEPLYSRPQGANPTGTGLRNS